MAITNPMLNEFRKDFEKAMKDLEAKYNISVKLGNISHNSASFSAKISASALSEDGVKVLNAKQQWYVRNNLLPVFKNLADTDTMGAKIVTVTGQVGIITDIDTSKKKYPIIAVINGKSYKLAPDQIRSINGISNTGIN